MKNAERAFGQAIVDGTIVGSVLLAGDVEGKFRYAKSFGRRRTLASSEPLQTDDIFQLISVTKILVSVAAMQLVERQVISLDDDVCTLLPELAKEDILLGFDDAGNPVFQKREKPILFRHLLTHSAGMPYMDPLLLRYLSHLGRKPLHGTTVYERFGLPLLAEPDTQFHYGSAIDWVGKVIEKLSGQSLDTFVRENICKPLGIADVTLSVDRLSEFVDRLVETTMMNDDSKAVPNTLGSINDGIKDCFGGQSGFANLESLLEVLKSLAANDGKLLKQETIHLMFAPQLSSASKAFLNKQIQEQSGLAHLFTEAEGTEYDWNFAGRAMLTRDGNVARTDWFGMMNTQWFIDHETGLCGIFGVQVLPMGHPEITKLYQIWKDDVFEAYQRSRD